MVAEPVLVHAALQEHSNGRRRYPGQRAMRPRAVLNLLAWVWLMGLVNVAGAGEMVRIKGNHPVGFEQAQPTGRIPGDRLLAMNVIFNFRNGEALNQLLSEQQDPNSPNYHHWLGAEQFFSRFGPDSRKFKAVGGWLASAGFNVVSADIKRRSIRFTGRADQAERVFRTKIVTYPDGHFANTVDPSIPARFAGAIREIRGLENVSHIRRTSKLQGCGAAGAQTNPRLARKG